MRIQNIKRNSKGQFITSWAKHRIKVKCTLCSKEFEVVESKLRNGRGKYCSRECYYKVGKSDKTKRLLSKVMKGKRNSKSTEFKKGIVPWVKGREHPNKSKGIPRFELRGKNSPCWKGGQKRYKHTTSRVEYKKWRERVFERDNYTCKDCGRRGCYLEAHHIKGWAKHPKSRYDINNGLTLCLECHKKTDNYKGKGV